MTNPSSEPQNFPEPPKFKAPVTKSKIYYNRIINNYIKQHCLISSTYNELVSEIVNRTYTLTGVTTSRAKIEEYLIRVGTDNGLKVDKGVIYNPKLEQRPLFGKFFPLMQYMVEHGKKKRELTTPSKCPTPSNSGFALK